MQLQSKSNRMIVLNTPFEVTRKVLRCEPQGYIAAKTTLNPARATLF